MAIFTGGSIPTINVSSNTLINNAVTGVAGNLAETTLSVALSPVLGAQLSSQLGLNPSASFSNLGNIVSNGVVSTGQQYLNQVINQQIVNSKALGPFGPLVGGLAQNAAGVLTQGVSGLLTGQGFSGFGGLAGLFGGGGGGSSATASAPNNVPSRAFPGAGDEPYGDGDANYGGFVYNTGNGGPDVVFSIKPATTQAAASAASSVANPLASATASATEAFNGAIGDFNFTPKFTDIASSAYSGNLAGAFSGGLGTSSAMAAFGGISSSLI